MTEASKVPPGVNGRFFDLSWPGERAIASPDIGAAWRECLSMDRSSPVISSFSSIGALRHAWVAWLSLCDTVVRFGDSLLVVREQAFEESAGVGWFFVGDTWGTAAPS